MNAQSVSLAKVANNLPERPFKKVRILKSRKTQMANKNVWHWLVSDGRVNVGKWEGESLGSKLKDENNITHVLFEADRALWSRNFFSEEYETPSDKEHMGKHLVGEEKPEDAWSMYAFWNRDETNNMITFQGVYKLVSSRECPLEKGMSKNQWALVANQYNLNNGGICGFIRDLEW